MMTIMLNKKGQVVIPAQVRKKYNIKEGSKLCIEDYGNMLVIRPFKKGFFDKFAGILNDGKESLTKELLRERAEDRKKEKKRL